MRERAEPQTWLVHGVQRRDVLFGGLGAYRVSSPVRSAERGQRVVSPAGRIPYRGPGDSGNNRVAPSRYGRARWLASTTGLALAAILLIIHHVFGG